MLADFLIDAAAAYLVYAASYAGFAWQILSNATHGRTSAWKELFLQLSGVFPSEGVKFCRDRELVSLPYAIAAENGVALQNMINVSRKINRAIIRLEVLRNWRRMFAFGLLFAVILSFVASSPVLFGYQRWTYTIALYAAFSALFFGVFFNLPHAVLWSHLGDECNDTNRAMSCGNFNPVS